METTPSVPQRVKVVVMLVVGGWGDGTVGMMGGDEEGEGGCLAMC